MTTGGGARARRPQPFSAGSGLDDGDPQPWGAEKRGGHTRRGWIPNSPDRPDAPQASGACPPHRTGRRSRDPRRDPNGRWFQDGPSNAPPRRRCKVMKTRRCGGPRPDTPGHADPAGRQDRPRGPPASRTVASWRNGAGWNLRLLAGPERRSPKEDVTLDTLDRMARPNTIGFGDPGASAERELETWTGGGFALPEAFRAADRMNPRGGSNRDVGPASDGGPRGDREGFIPGACRSGPARGKDWGSGSAAHKIRRLQGASSTGAGPTCASPYGAGAGAPTA